MTDTVNVLRGVLEKAVAVIQHLDPSLQDVGEASFRALVGSLAAAPKVEQEPVQSLVNFDVEAYVDEYELRTDEGDYVPNEKERLLITDAIHGVVSELCQSHPAPASDELLEAAEECLSRMLDAWPTLIYASPVSRLQSAIAKLKGQQS